MGVVLLALLMSVGYRRMGSTNSEKDRIFEMLRTKERALRDKKRQFMGNRKKAELRTNDSDPSSLSDMEKQEKEIDDMIHLISQEQQRILEEMRHQPLERELDRRTRMNDVRAELEMHRKRLLEQKEL